MNHLKSFILTAALALVSLTSANAQILITEINSNGTGGDFFEIYNTGSSDIDLTNWRWADRDLRAWSTGNTLNSGSTLLAGEAAVVPVGSGGGTTAALDAFRSSWGLSSSVKLFGWTGAGAGLAPAMGSFFLTPAETWPPPLFIAYFPPQSLLLSRTIAQCSYPPLSRRLPLSPRPAAMPA